MPTHTARSLDLDLEAANIPKVTDEGKVDFHALRSTFATLLVDGGAHPKEAQALLRHASLDMTMNVYARTRPERLRGLAESVGNALQDGAECAIYVQRGHEATAQIYRKKLQKQELGALDPKDGGGFDSRRLHHYSECNNALSGNRSERAFCVSALYCGPLRSFPPPRPVDLPTCISSRFGHISPRFSLFSPIPVDSVRGGDFA